MLIAVCIIVILLLALVLSNLKINISYVYDEKLNKLSATVGIGFLKFDLVKADKKDINSVPDKIEQEVDKKLENVRQMFRNIYDSFKLLNKKLKINIFRFNIKLGTGNAAGTAILSGVAWAVPYEFLGLLDRQFTLKKHDIKVEPIFDSEVFEIDFGIGASVRTVSAIAAGIKFCRSQKGRKEN